MGKIGVIFCDIDGVLSDKQARWQKPNHARIERIKQLIKQGFKVVIWSGQERYAKEWCKHYGIKPYLAIAKPDLMIDNQLIPSKRRKLITQDQFDDMELEPLNKPHAGYYKDCFELGVL